MKIYSDGSNNFPLVEKSTSSAGSSPTAANFNGPTAELVAIVRAANFPLDPLSGALIGSDGKPLMESESNKQILRAVENIAQKSYLKSVDEQQHMSLAIMDSKGGISWGLEITQVDTLKISIAVGRGYGNTGEEFNVDTPIFVDLNDYATDGNKTYRVYLQWSITPADYVIGADPLNYQDTIIYTPSITDYYLDKTVPNKSLYIGYININSSGVSGITQGTLWNPSKKFYPIGYEYRQSKSMDWKDYPENLFGGIWESNYSSTSDCILNNVPTIIQLSSNDIPEYWQKFIERVTIHRFPNGTIKFSYKITQMKIVDSYVLLYIPENIPLPLVPLIPTNISLVSTVASRGSSGELFFNEIAMTTGLNGGDFPPEPLKWYAFADQTNWTNSHFSFECFMGKNAFNYPTDKQMIWIRTG